MIVRAISGIYFREPCWRDVVFFGFVIVRRNERTPGVCAWTDDLLRLQHAMRMRRIVICGLPHIFSTLSHKRQDFRRKSLLNVQCVFPVSLQRFPENSFSFEEEMSEI